MGVLDRAESLAGLAESETGQLLRSIARAALEGAEESKQAAGSAAEGVGSAAQSVGEGAKTAAEKVDGAAKPALIVAGGLVALTAASAAVSAIRRRIDPSTDGDEAGASDGADSAS